MPPKRKAMAETSTNKPVTRHSKASKTSSKSTAPKEAANSSPNNSEPVNEPKALGKAIESEAKTSRGAPKSKAPEKNANSQGKATKTLQKPAASNESSSSESFSRSSASKSTVKAKCKAFKYCNENTLSKKPSYISLEWPNLSDFAKDKKQDMPRPGQKLDDFCNRVSDLGIPVSEDGQKVCEKLNMEQMKRDQYACGVSCYEDWNGWGMSEVMSNLLQEFDRDLFKKTVSPFKKWAYVEGLMAYLMIADLDDWMGNEDGDSVKEIANMLGVMVLTTYDVLLEHNLFKPDSEIKNIGIVSLLYLQFLAGEASDLDCEWGCEVVRLCDQAGLPLDKDVRKQVSVSKEDIESLRKTYEGKATGYDFLDDAKNKDAYKTFAAQKDWKPKHDTDDPDLGGPGRLWYRWDWALEYPDFAKDHKGGNHYDLTKGGKKRTQTYEWATDDSD